MRAVQLLAAFATVAVTAAAFAGPKATGLTCPAGFTLSMEGNVVTCKKPIAGLACPAGYTLAVESNVLTCKKPGTEKLYPMLCKKPSGETVRMTPVKGPDACPAGSKLEACPFGSALVVDHNFERDDCVQSTTDYVAPTSK